MIFPKNFDAEGKFHVEGNALKSHLLLYRLKGSIFVSEIFTFLYYATKDSVDEY